MKNKFLKLIVMIIMISLVISNMISTFATDSEIVENTTIENTSPEEEEPVQNQVTEEPEENPVENTTVTNEVPIQNEVVENQIEEDNNVVENEIVNETNTVTNDITNSIVENTISNQIEEIQANEISSEETIEQVNIAIQYATKAQSLDLKDKGLNELIVYGYDEENKQYVLALSPDFNTNVYNYNIQAGLNIKNIEIEYTLIDEDGIVEKYGKTELEPGVNFITIIARNEKFTENVTYQISVNKLDPSVLPTYDGLDENAESFKIKKILLYVCIAVIAVGAIIFIILEFILGKTEKMPESVRERNKRNVEKILQDVEGTSNTSEKRKKSKGKH